MHEEFVDDRLNSDMTEIRKIMEKVGTNPVFKVEFRRNASNDIVMVVSSEYTTMPPNSKTITVNEQIGQELIEYISDTAKWV